ncbi:MAG: cysteine--tRNA ligase [Patescibacteria group bacterium]|nr:cysteine--tRNA ligase [Patescibacteria group bacterium]
MLTLYNTLGRKKQIFKPLRQTQGKPSKDVRLYCCGPTVYYFAHIGNLRSYLFEDFLKRILAYNGFSVKHVMNITDVGHLTSDADTGEDKLEKGAAREKKTVWEVAEFYTTQFKKDLAALNVLPPNVWIKATDTIQEQIDIIKILERKGFTYTISDGVYFDTTKLKNYGVLWGNKKPAKMKAGARVEVVEGKKNAADFALWKFSLKDQKRQMEWPSPWGIGFPGWHTECVAMSKKELGLPFDIHCGGIDHIQVHHTNEIAQTQAAYGIMMANFWMHGDFLNMRGEKMAKSEGNILTVDVLKEKGFNPLSYRYLCLSAHYRSKLAFSFESLQAAQNALNNFYKKVAETASVQVAERWSLRAKNYKERFLEFVNNDLNIPQALALTWKMLDDKNLANQEKYGLALDFDKVFGLDLDKIKARETPKEVLDLAEQREKLRKAKEWQLADEIRKKIEKLGYEVEDTAQGPTIKQN